MDLRCFCRVFLITALISLVCQPCSVRAGDIVHDDDLAPKKPGCENDFVLVKVQTWVDGIENAEFVGVGARFGSTIVSKEKNANQRRLILSDPRDCCSALGSTGTANLCRFKYPIRPRYGDDTGTAEGRTGDVPRWQGTAERRRRCFSEFWGRFGDGMLQLSATIQLLYWSFRQQLLLLLELFGNNRQQHLANDVIMVDRGHCKFTTKANNAQAAHASAVLIINNEKELYKMVCEPDETDLDIHIPAVMLPQDAGASLEKMLTSNSSVSVQLYSPTRPLVDIAEVFLWLMAVGTILCASYWSARSCY
ncbi:Signal peptide peptidase-like 4 [Hibiscus syriacus]|uniref:Signal peptide peptidase-like 4 n=1 Tax=Hibiscus syriacus TaxID=106335 RepID=A0A6A2XLI2_HIBSY|nr:Signal peptide peptidase-like 4 [Hibiscus syriacus]